jgi:hypothetical protein
MLSARCSQNRVSLHCRNVAITLATQRQAALVGRRVKGTLGCLTREGSDKCSTFNLGNARQFFFGFFAIKVPSAPTPRERSGCRLDSLFVIVGS